MTPNIKVLYVDDDKEWQEIVREVVSTLGYQIEIVSTSKDAMSKLKRSTFHIALLDKRLDENDPENQDGLSIATVIAGIDDGTRIIVYTAYGEIDDARRAFHKIKVSDFLPKKPISELRNALKVACEEAIVEFNRPSRLSKEILMAKGDALDQFIAAFISNPGLSTNSQTLEFFAKRLLGDYRPLLPDQSDAKLLHVSGFVILQVKYWSKMLGMPIAAWFGKYNEIKTTLGEIESGEALRSSLKIARKVDELFDPVSFPDFGGAVFELKDTEIEEFESALDIQL